MTAAPRSARAGHSRRIAWYAARLRAMDAPEAAERARRAVANRFDAALWSAPPLWRRRWLPDAAKVRTSRPLEDRPLGLWQEHRLREALTAAPEEAEAVVARAAALLDGRVRFFGYPEIRLDEPTDPSYDPFTGARWPQSHGKLLDYRRAAYGDPKWIWELNRCQDLPLLCLASAAAGDSRFAEAAARRMLQWVSSSSPGRGIAWSNGFEAGLRGASLALTLDALRGSGLLAVPDAEGVLRALWQHARWIIRDRSFGSSANNHLIGEAAGLVAIGLLAPELAESGAWVDLGLGWLETEAARQILPDGGNAEQAFGYQLFVCDLFLLVAALLESRGRPVPREIEAALERSSSALALQVRPGEPQPAYGDDDHGRAFLLDARDERDAQAVAAALASATGHPGAAFLGVRPDLTSRILFGETGVRRFESGAATGPPAASGVLGDTGLVVLRRETSRSTFDVGPLGYLAIAAHGHADALSVTLSDRDVELVSDPGTGTYFGDATLRHWFRSTAAHATVTVDGLDQAVYGGPFLWLEHPATRLSYVDLAAGVAVGESDAWSRLPDPVRHRRAVVALSDGSLLVYDRLDARLPHRYAQSWPLHPALEPRTREESVIEARAGGESLLLVAFAPTSLEVLVHGHGDSSVNGGSWSRALQHVEPTSVLRAVSDGSGSAELVALLIPTRGTYAPDPGLRLESSVATFSLAGRARRVRFDLDAASSPVRDDEERT